MERAPDAIVGGGGVIGLAVARRLAKDGLRVTLLERGAGGREASWSSAGILSPRSPHRQDPTARLIERSIAAYPDFCAELTEESGVDTEYEPCGELSLLFDGNQLKIARSEARAVGDQTMPDGSASIEVYEPAQLVGVEPLVTRENDLVGAVAYRQSAQVRSPRLLQALKIACERAGVTIRENTPVEDIITVGDLVTGVQTDTATVHCGRVILCAGAWSSQLAPRLGAIIPVHPVRGQIVCMKLEQRPFTSVISSGRTYLVPRRDGHLLLGSTEEPEAGFSRRTTPHGIADLIAAGVKLVPSIGQAPVVATWAGLRPGTPDERPYLGPVPGFDGMIAATGHFRSGLTVAPVTADIVSAIVSGKTYDVDLTPFRPNRA